MRKILFSLVFIFAFLLKGCADPTIDGSTDETVISSFEKIKGTLQEDERERFNDAFMLLVAAAVQSVNEESFLLPARVVEERTGKRVRETVGGLNALEIIAKGEKLEAELNEKHRKEYLAEIEKLEQKKSDAESLLRSLEKLEVKKASYSMTGSRSWLSPVIELSLKNNTEYAISKIRFKATATSPERTIPWAESYLSHDVKGGIEPGEETTIKVFINRYTDWGNRDIPSDVVLTAVIDRIYGANEELLFSRVEFSKEDEENLKRLKDEYQANYGK